jgi:dienelactone hydrolase
MAIAVVCLPLVFSPELASGEDAKPPQPAGWPELPKLDAAVTLPAQEWPQRPGPRFIKVLVHYPEGTLDSVNAETGLMLTLHNWGGTDCVGTADPVQLARRLNVVALCVNYLQSGKQDSIEKPEPYDFGYLQALDALRALYFAFDGLKQKGVPFAGGRIYATGGSGGGNVTPMANKLAPRTFACIVDMCGMAKLSDDIAFNLPGGSSLNARWSRDPQSPNYLSPDEQQLRFVGNLDHLLTMRRLGNRTQVVVVHGVDDATCPFADAQEMVDSLMDAGIGVEPRFIRKKDLDGTIFTSSGHPLGNRTQIVFQVGNPYLSPTKPVTRTGPSDFERRDEAVRYRTTNGEFVISYKQGFPVGRFERHAEPPLYPEHQNLMYRLDDSGQRHKIATAADWDIRRRHILDNMERVMGRLPSPEFRIPLVAREEGAAVRVGNVTRLPISLQSDPDDRVTAYLFLPDSESQKSLLRQKRKPPQRPAVLCLHQTFGGGKDEPAGIAGDASLHYALHLAQRGFITLAPDYPSLGEHAYDFDPKHGYASGTMKAIWDNIRCIDYLQARGDVDPDRIGCIGHSLGGHSAMFTAAFDTRIKAIVSSCGFTRFHKDDLPSWTGPRYMPRIASVYRNDPDRVPFDFTEIIGNFAPRPFLACAAERDADFDVTGVREAMAAARPVYELLGAADNLQAYYPNTEHAFPPDARDKAYEFLEKYLSATAEHATR